MANTPPDDAELERLLTRLLGMVSPAFGNPSNMLVSQSAQAAAETGNSGAAAAVREDDPLSPPAAAVREDDHPSPAAAAVRGDDPPSPPEGRPAAGGVGGAIAPVTASEARALIELVAARGIAQGELAGLLGLDKSTVSRLAAGLERRGWVRRGRDEGNQRYVRLYLTPAGGEAAARVWQTWQARQARILATLSEDERAGLAAGLRGLIRGLSADRGPGADAESAARQTAGFP
jgi:DNA-binding MarR family transcriptional regulator